MLSRYFSFVPLFTPSEWRRRVVVVALLLLAAGTTGSLQAYPPIYSVKKAIHPTDLLSAPGGAPMVVTGLNATGGVGGYLPFSTIIRGIKQTDLQGFFWDDTAQTLTGFNGELGASSSMVTCLNDAGTAAGIYWSTAGLSQQLGFTWQNGTVATFLSPDGGDIDSVVAINSSGLVIGTYFGNSGYKRAFVWDGNTSTDLGDLGDPTRSFVWPQAINSFGQIIGTLYVVDSRSTAIVPNSTAFQWQDGNFGALDGTDDFAFTIAVGLNDAGEILGSYLNLSPIVRNQYVPGGFYWYAVNAMDLGDLGGGGTTPVFINAAGTITGTTYAADNTLHLFTWTAGALTDLGNASLSATDTGFQLSSVNQGGDSAGFVSDASGNCQGFLWTAGSIYNLTALTAANPPFTVDDSNGTRIVVNDAGLVACSGFSQGAPVVLLLTNDSDGNGLPDGWETHYFGHTGVNPSMPLAWNSNLTVLQAFQQGLNPVDFYNGNPPTLAVVSGNGQTGGPGEFLPLPLVVAVTAANGQSLVNAPVTFTVTQGGGQVQRSSNSPPGQAITVLTDDTGLARMFFKLSNAANDPNRITVTPGSGSAATTPIFTEYGNGVAGTNNSPFNPSHVVATMNRDGSADVSWTNNADPTDLEPIDIRYKDRNGVWQVLTSVNGQASSYHIPAP